MPQRDCSKLTLEQLEFLAGVPGNADVVAELEKRRAQPVMYTTHGSVCDGCGHKHATIDEAVSCIENHHEACHKQGGYSDRKVVRTDGKPMTDSEYDQIFHCTH